MEKPFYEFNLLDDLSLNDELENLYDFCHDVNRYTKLIFRGTDLNIEGFNNSIKFFDSYDSLLKDYNQISSFIEEFPTQFIGQFSLYGESISWENYPKIYNYILLKVLELYGDDIIIRKIDDTTFRVKKLIIDVPLLTMYKKLGSLSKHSDGKSTLSETHKKFKPANILLYLNKNYNEEWGGNFIVDEQIVTPEYGKLVFLNFRNDSDPVHEVSRLKKDINRVALLFNVMYSLTEREILKIQ